MRWFLLTLILLIPQPTLMADDETMLRRAAEAGSAPAQFDLGRLLHGQGTALSLAEAAEWFRKAADQSLAEAQYNLAVQLSMGQGVAKDEVEAARWMLAAADQGLAEAQFGYSKLLTRGQGVEPDVDQAILWLRRAATREHADAQYALALAHNSGHGVPQDPVQVFFWLSLAAEGGQPKAKVDRDRIEKLMTPSQLAEVEKLLRDWRRAHRQ